MSASGDKNDLVLVIKALDNVTKPAKELRERLDRIFAPQQGAALESVFGKWAGVQDAAGKVGASIGPLALKFGALAVSAGAAFYKVVHGAMDAGDELSKNAGRVGLSVDAYAALEYSAQQADVSQEEFSAGMDKLNKQMGEMTVGDGGEYLKFLREVSPQFAKQMKGAKTTEQALGLLASAFSKIPDPQRRADLAAHSFGKTNLQMAEWLKQGNQAIDAQRAKFIALVGSQEDSAQAASDLDNALKDVGVAFDGARKALGSAFFQTLVILANKVTAIVSDHRASLAAWAKESATEIKAWLDDGGLDRLVKTLKLVIHGVTSVVRWLGPMGTALAVAGVALAPLLGALVSLGGTLFTLGGALVSFGATVVPVFVAAWPGVLTVLGMAASAFGSLAVSVGAALAPFLPFIAAGSALAYLGKTVYDNWADIVDLFKNFGETLKYTVLGAWEAVQPILEKMSSVIGGPFKAALTVGEMTAEKLRPADAFVGAPSRALPSGGNAHSTVTVDFTNLPRGARVSSPEGNAPVNVSAGMSMVGP